MDSLEKKYDRKIQHPGDSRGFPGGREMVLISWILPGDSGGITCMLELDDKILRCFPTLPPYLKSRKKSIFEMCQTHICTFKLFLVFSHNIELGYIIRIKERNILGKVHIRENQQLENCHFKPFFGCFVS